MVDLFGSSERLGHVWLEMSEPGKGFTLGPAVLQGVRKLLAPIGALRLLADDVALPVSEQLKQKIVAVQSVVNISELFLGDDPLFEHSSIWADGERDATESILNRMKERLEYCHRRALEAEKILARAGRKFNPATRKIVRIAGHAGRDLLGECVWMIYKKEYKVDRNTFATRRKIAAKLARYFDMTELSPKSGAPIYMTIYKRENPPR